MVEFDVMALGHQIIAGMSIAGLGGLFTFLWKMNSRMQKTDDLISNLCNHVKDSEGDVEKLAEHEIEIKMLKVEITNIKLSMHDFRESMDKRFDEVSSKIDRLCDQNNNNGDHSAVRQDFRARRK